LSVTPTDGVDGDPERGGPDRSFLAGAAATFFTLLLLAEAAARLAAGTGWLYRRLDFSGSLTSLPELRQRIAWNASRPRPVFVLGDSVLGATALWEGRVAHPRRLTVPAQLAAPAAAAGWSVSSLAADGLLLPDLEAIGRELPGASPARTLIVLNFRMFAPEFADPAKAISREFLLPALDGRLPDPRLGRRDDALGDRLAAAAAERCLLARTGWQLQPLWYFPTRRDAFRRLLEPQGAELLESPDLREAALHLKVDPYYRDRWDPSSIAFRALGALLDESRARGAAVAAGGRAETIVVLTPQNPDFVADAETFAWNRRVLGEFVARRGGPGGGALVYRDLADRFPSERFLDHCHLTPEGNREYAGLLLRFLTS
jgi:hypothetical protein